MIANQRRSSRRRLALRDRLERERRIGEAELFSVGLNEAVVREALCRLRPTDREVLLLAEWENLAPAEIAVILGCLTVTARGRLHRARFRFRAVFEELLADRGGNASIEKGDVHVGVRHIQRAQASEPGL